MTKLDVVLTRRVSTMPLSLVEQRLPSVRRSSGVMSAIRTFELLR